MLARLVVIVFMVSVAAPGVRASCIYPRPPANIPDGDTATYDQMVAAQTAVKQFDSDVTAYNACLGMELQSIMASTELDDARKAELQEIRAKKNNAAVDEAQSVADHFNEQLRKYKSAAVASSAVMAQPSKPPMSSSDKSWESGWASSTNNTSGQSERSGLTMADAKQQCLASKLKQGSEEFGKCVLQLLQ